MARSDEKQRLERRLALRLSLLLFLFFLLFQHGHFAGSDEVGVYEQTRSLYERGSLSVPKGYHTYRGRDGLLYSHFAVGQSLLALPFYASGRLADLALPDSWRVAVAGPEVRAETVRWGGTVEIFAVSLYAPVASTVLAAIFFFWQRHLGASARASVAATLLVATTSYVAMMSIYFLQHTTEAIAILGGFYLLRRFGEGAGLGTIARGSAVSSSTVLVRVASVAAGPALAGYALWTLWRRSRLPVRPPMPSMLAALGLPFLAVVAIHVGLNYAKWETWFDSPMVRAGRLMNAPMIVGLRGFLLSPGCSLFVYSPLLLLSPLLLAFSWHRHHRPECITALGILALFLFECARYDFWTGLWSSPGPRLLFAVVPVLLLDLGPWLDAHPARALRAGVVVLAALGFLIQLGLMAVHWPAVIEIMHYRDYLPPKGFLFVASQSPIPASFSALRGGWVDTWLWNLAVGWPGRAGTPAVAAALFLLWASAFGFSALSMRRALERLAATGAVEPPLGEAV